MNEPISDEQVLDRVRGHYEAKSLRPEKMNEILREIAEVTPVSGNATGSMGRKQFNSWRWLAAAGVALALVISGVWAWSGDDGLTRVVAREIAINHVKGLASDYPAEAFGDLSLMSDKLGFTPIEPSGLAERGLTLEGGRYCSVQGCMAAQLRVTDESGDSYTLYQVRPDERIAGLGPATATVDGVDVEIWSEAGLVMGLARTR